MKKVFLSALSIFFLSVTPILAVSVLNGTTSAGPGPSKVSDKNTVNSSNSKLSSVLEMMGAGVFRVEVISGKLDSRIAKIKANGKNVTLLTARGGTIRKNIDQAKADLLLVSRAASASSQSADPTGDFRTAGKELKSIRELLTEILNLEKESLSAISQATGEAVKPTGF